MNIWKHGVLVSMVTRFKANICSGDIANLEVYVDSYQVIYRFKGFCWFQHFESKVAI